MLLYRVMANRNARRRSMMHGAFVCRPALLLGLSFGIAGSPLELPAGSIRVMTFNLRYASAGDGSNAWMNAVQEPERRAVAVDSITEHLPDLVGYQEGEDGQLDDLISGLPASYSFERQKPSGGSGNENAAFCYNTNNLELLDRGVFSLGPSPGGGLWNNAAGVKFDPWSTFPENLFAFPRISLWGRFRWIPTGQEFFFYTSHFDVFNGANNGESQVKSAMLVTQDAVTRANRIPSSPLAVCVGDFNSSQNDRAWKLFTGSYTNDGVTGDFRDAWLDANGNVTDAGTFHGFNGGTVSGNSRIDWILTRGLSATQTFLVTQATISTNTGTMATHILYPSDHYPVVTDLLLPPLSADFDRDGLPDSNEFASGLSNPSDADSDDDDLLDGEEDINGSGVVDSGETDPSNGTDTQLPTDLRNFQMDGLLDYRATSLGSNGLNLSARFDGRYLYVSVQDAGEGSDHFIFITRSPTVPSNAPFAKTGQVAAWDAFLADENDNDFSGWFNADRLLMTNDLMSRASTYYQNGGALEGVLDLANFYGSGFTSSFYVAAAPYATADGGSLFSGAQVPVGNGDSDLLGMTEFILIQPGDMDGDGINDLADPDRDGDGLPDTWESAHGLNPSDTAGGHGGDGDPDGDGVSNVEELGSRTHPNDATDALRIQSIDHQAANVTIEWVTAYDLPYVVLTSTSLTNNAPSQAMQTNQFADFPRGTNSINLPIGGDAKGYVRLRVNSQ